MLLMTPQVRRSQADKPIHSPRDSLISWRSATVSQIILAMSSVPCAHTHHELHSLWSSSPWVLLNVIILTMSSIPWAHPHHSFPALVSRISRGWSTGLSYCWAWEGSGSSWRISTSRGALIDGISADIPSRYGVRVNLTAWISVFWMNLSGMYFFLFLVFEKQNTNFCLFVSNYYENHVISYKSKSKYSIYLLQSTLLPNKDTFNI